MKYIEMTGEELTDDLRKNISDCFSGRIVNQYCANKIFATGMYYHCTSSLSLALSSGISVDIGVKGISLSVSGGISISPYSVYSQITNNPVCEFFPK